MAEPERRGLLCVVGGESTGKSTLAAALGAQLPAVVVPEFLRSWVDQRGRVPRSDEQAAVMAAHREAELAAMHRAGRTGSPWVVSDSGPLMTAVYSIQYYEDASLLPLAVQWAAHSTAVVWCQADFPWQPDEQRDGSLARAASQEILAEVFAAHPQLRVLAVEGPLEERVQTVVRLLSEGGSGGLSSP